MTTKEKNSPSWSSDYDCEEVRPPTVGTRSTTTQEEEEEVDIETCLPAVSSPYDLSLPHDSGKGFFNTLNEWIDDCNFGPLAKDNQVDHFRFPQVILYIMAHVANFYMSLYTLLFCGGRWDTNPFTLWLGFWALTTEIVTWGIQFPRFISVPGVLAAMLHNHTELLVGVYSISKLEMKKTPEIALFLLTFLFISQTQYYFSFDDIKKSISWSIVIGDLMHYIGISLVTVAIIVDKDIEKLWILGAFFLHHLYDLLNYPGSPIKVVPKYVVTVLSTVQIALVLTYCILYQPEE